MAPRPASEPVAGGENAEPGGSRRPEWFMEQVMEGLSDACMLVEGSGRLLYVNGAAKKLLCPKGRVLGRKLDAVLANRQLSMLAADVYHTGKPVFTKLGVSLPGEAWRQEHTFHASLVPLWISTVRRLVRIALREVPLESAPSPGGLTIQVPDSSTAPPQSKQCTEVITRLRNPLTILQGYLENLLDGAIKDPVAVRQTLLTMRKHTLNIEKLMEACGK